MRITKFGHSCVRIEYDGRALVIDPGMFTDPGAVEGAEAILITHEHNDHWDADLLRESDAPIHTITEVADKIRAEAPDVAERISIVEPGSSFEAGLPVRAIGELHAVIHPEFPRVHNSGYLVTAGDQLVYHPGDSLVPPGEAIDVLCAPASAAWLKASEAIDFVREVKAPTNLSVHDRIYTEAAHDILERHMSFFLSKTGQSWVRLDDGADL
jgi:L-ascorbate metabolism protein UlaG (beta-lactamase superfamily)